MSISSCTLLSCACKCFKCSSRALQPLRILLTSVTLGSWGRPIFPIYCVVCIVCKFCFLEPNWSWTHLTQIPPSYPTLTMYTQGVHPQAVSWQCACIQHPGLKPCKADRHRDGHLCMLWSWWRWRTLHHVSHLRYFAKSIAFFFLQE